MKFTNHLFISYAHIDNERAEENDPGWVDRRSDGRDEARHVRGRGKRDVPRRRRNASQAGQFGDQPDLRDIKAAPYMHILHIIYVPHELANSNGI